MALELIIERLKTAHDLNPQTAPAIALEFALKEIAQEIALRGLAVSGFFKWGVFHGGTCLRIIHGMQRFSEDLDFALISPDRNFATDAYLKAVQDELAASGLDSQIEDKNRAGVTVTKHFIKMQSIGKILNIESRVGRRKQVRIKVEIDTNPPADQKTASGTVLWPSAFSVVSQDMPTLFAGKIHALLCRTYEKGRDWYDFLWYVQRGTHVNRQYLKNALVQTNYANKSDSTDIPYIKEALKKRLGEVDFQKIKDDVRPLVQNSREIDLWSKGIFFDVIEKMEA